MRFGTLAGVDNSPVGSKQMADEIVTLDWDHEHARFEREMFGLIRVLGFKALKRTRRPKACWNDVVDDMVIFAWRACRSLRLRGLEPQEIGVCASSDRAVRSSLQGARFQPVGTMGDRSWSDSVHNQRNGVKIRSNTKEWQLEGAVGDGQEDSDRIADWRSWKATLGEYDQQIVEALEAGDMERLVSIKGLKRRKRALADGFRAFRGVRRARQVEGPPLLPVVLHSKSLGTLGWRSGVIIRHFYDGSVYVIKVPDGSRVRRSQVAGESAIFVPTEGGGVVPLFEVPGK